MRLPRDPRALSIPREDLILRQKMYSRKSEWVMISPSYLRKRYCQLGFSNWDFFRKRRSWSSPAWLRLRWCHAEGRIVSIWGSRRVRGTPSRSRWGKMGETGSQTQERWYRPLQVGADPMKVRKKSQADARHIDSRHGEAFEGIVTSWSLSCVR